MVESSLKKMLSALKKMLYHFFYRGDKENPHKNMTIYVYLRQARERSKIVIVLFVLRRVRKSSTKIVIFIFQLRRERKSFKKIYQSLVNCDEKKTIKNILAAFGLINRKKDNLVVFFLNLTSDKNLKRLWLYYFKQRVCD